MRVKELIERLDLYPRQLSIMASDLTGAKNVPCCVRREGERVVIDVIPQYVADLNQAGLGVLSTVDLKERLGSSTLRGLPVVISDYDGKELSPTCIRQDNGTTLCIDVEGIL